MILNRRLRRRSTPQLKPMMIAVSFCLAASWVQPLCGFTPVKYLPEILSSDIRPHSRLEVSPDGHEMYWSGYIKGEGTTEWMFWSVRQGDGWTAPEKVPFNGGLGNGPAFGPDGVRLFFGSQGRLEADGPVYFGIWYVERTKSGWSDVKPVTVTLDTTGFAGRPSLSRTGNLYYLARGTRSEIPAIFKCTLDNGAYSEPEMLTGAFAGEIVMDPWIDPHERILLLMFDWTTSRPSHGSSDLYISFRQDDDSWSEPKNLGSGINSEHFDRSPSLSRDGKFLIFIRAVGEVFVESDAHFYRVRFLRSPDHDIPVFEM